MHRASAWIYLLLLTMACAADTASDQASIPSKQSEDWADCFAKGVVMGIALGEVGQFPNGAAEAPGRPDCLPDPELQVTLEPGIVKDRCLSLKLRMRHPDSAKNATLFSELQTVFSEQYGPCSPAPGYATWTGASAAGTLIEIELMDGQALFGRDEVMATWREHQDRKYED